MLILPKNETPGWGHDCYTEVLLYGAIFYTCEPFYRFDAQQIEKKFKWVPTNIPRIDWTGCRITMINQGSFMDMLHHLMGFHIHLIQYRMGPPKL